MVNLERYIHSQNSKAEHEPEINANEEGPNVYNSTCDHPRPMELIKLVTLCFNIDSLSQYNSYMVA